MLLALCAVPLAFLVAAGPSDLLDMQDYPLRPMVKTFIITEEMPLPELAKLKKLPRTAIRVVMQGNMIRDSWIAALNDLEVDRIEILIGPDLNRRHVTQLKKLRKLAVVLDLGGERFKTALANELAALGPVRKTIIVRPGFIKSWLDRFGVLKTWDVLFDARGGDLSVEELSMIADVPGMKRVLVKSTLPAAEYAKLKGMKSASVVVEVEKNAIGEDPAAAAVAAAGIPITLQVTDGIDEEKYKALFVLSAFDLEIIPVNVHALRQKVVDLVRRTDP